MKSRDSVLTQQFSTWGDKLLNHADVLFEVQQRGTWRPITVQLAPTEVCDSDCPFCSVQNRPTNVMAYGRLTRCLAEFKHLGAKSLEITGGGNPMLYRSCGKDINDIVSYASTLGYDIGIITNSSSLKKLKPEVFPLISWIRVSLIKLEEGVDPEHYDFNGFPQEKLGFSYIVYSVTSEQSIRRICRMVDLYPGVKFVRVAGDCLVKGNNAEVYAKFRELFDTYDTHGKVFFKTIENDDSPLDEGCYVGAVRPYVASSPEGDDYLVYPCTSYVLQKRTYDRAYSLCRVEDVVQAWKQMSDNQRLIGYPYAIKGNGGRSWCSTCKYCYYKNNNRVLHTVTHALPDKNFA